MKKNLKKVYVVGYFDDNGGISGRITVYSSYSRALQALNFLKDICNSYSFDIEEHYVQ